MVSYSAMRRTSLVDGENILKLSWTQSLLHHQTHTRYIWARKIPSMQLKSSLLSNTEGCDEIRHVMLKALNQGVLWLTRVCQVAWCAGRARKDGQIGVIIPIHKKGDRSELTNYRGISLLSIPGKVYAKHLKQDAEKLLNQNWMIPSAVLVPDVALQTKFSLSSKFSKNLGSMPWTSAHVLSTSRKHTTGFLVKNFWRCCGSTVSTAACYCVSSHCIPAQRFVFLWGELNHNR